MRGKGNTRILLRQLDLAPRPTFARKFAQFSNDDCVEESGGGLEKHLHFLRPFAITAGIGTCPLPEFTITGGND